MANLVFELEKKLGGNDSPGIKRNFDRMKGVLEEAGILLLDPLGEPYLETRTDLEASIASSASGPLVVLDVIKPVVYTLDRQERVLLQKGVVIIGAKTKS